MYRKEYVGFVRPDSSNTLSDFCAQKVIVNGDEAHRLYLEEICSANTKPINYCDVNCNSKNSLSNKSNQNCKRIELSNNELFRLVQNNDIEALKRILDYCPGKINILDEFGWSLLMIACQANAYDCVKELLNREVDTSIRDRAGNSARSLIIRNKNVTLATLFLEYTQKNESSKTVSSLSKVNSEIRNKEQYICHICNSNIFPDKFEHLSSTIHNINASKEKKVPTNYVIPSSNRGYQILLKGGWDRESGLGRQGTGRKCPIKTIPKYDRKGLGHGKHKNVKGFSNNALVNGHNKKAVANNYLRNKRMEINFRREFY